MTQVTQTQDDATRPGAQDPAALVLEKASALAQDLRLAGVREWKVGHPGALAIGHMPVYAPRPLLEAIGCLPVAVFGGGDQVDIIRGDSYFQSYICHIPRSTMEMALGGALDPLDGMIFPYICDVIRNLSGMWTTLFPDRYVALVDLPQNFEMALGGRFYALEMRRMARDLAARGALELTAERLARAIEAENSRRQALYQLDALRRAQPSRVPASEAYLVARAGAATPATTHAALIDAYLDAARQRQTRAYDNVRVVVVGAFCEQPPIDLIRTLERAGCDVVEDDFQLGLRAIEGWIEVRHGEDPVDSMARAYLERGSAMASRYVDQGQKGAALVRRVREVRADGVVFAAASFCDPALLDQPMLESALARAGIPSTSFKYAENTAQFQVIREQAGAFSDAVKLWGKAK